MSDPPANNPTTRTKRQIRTAYLRGEIGLSDAVPELMFEHNMERGEAFRYLGL